MATKTIGEYKKDYEAAKAAGDAAGMKAANDGANAIRASMGQAAQVASADIQRVAQSSQSQSNGSVSAGTGSAPAYTSPTPSQTYTSVPSGMGNSASGVGVNTSTQQSIKDRMNANSNAWWTATPEERARLEAENKSLAAQLGSGVTFDAKTGTWSGTADQITVPQTTAQVNDYSNYLEDMYAAKKRSALAQLDNAYQKNVNAIDRAGEGIGAQYQNARNQTAGASELAARNFAEYAAASGLNSGAGGQAELARNVALQNNLNDISTQESSTLADLELQRANAETNYNNAIAEAEATGDYELASALYQEKVRVEEALINQQIQQFQMDLQKYQLGYQADRDAVADSQWQQQFGYTTSQAEKENLIQTGTMFLQAGLIPPQSSLDAIGITATDAQSLINAIKLAAGSGSGNSYSVGGAGSGSGSGSSSTGTKSTMTLTTAKQAASNGYFDDNVLSVLHENGYSDEMLRAIYGYEGGSTASAPTYSLSAGAQNLLSQLQSAAASSLNQEAKVNLISAALRNGKITEADANTLLNYFGY